MELPNPAAVRPPSPDGRSFRVGQLPRTIVIALTLSMLVVGLYVVRALRERSRVSVANMLEAQVRGVQLSLDRYVMDQRRAARAWAALPDVRATVLQSGAGTGPAIAQAPLWARRSISFSVSRTRLRRRNWPARSPNSPK